MTDIDTVTGELVPTTERTLFRTDDPVEVLAAARDIAKALGPALKDGGMTQRIGPSEHVRIEGWQTLGSMLGVTPHVIWSRPLPDNQGWEARAEARTLDGRPVGSAEGMCSRAERNWARSEDYAVRSMAQTRAMSKALSGPLRFIVTLSGLSGTPAEEAIDDKPYGPAASSRDSQGLVRAIRVLYDTPGMNLEELAARLETDAGGYLPKIVARAVMLVAAHRPDRAEEEAGTGTGGTAEATPDPDGTPDPDPEVEPETREETT